MLRAGFGIGMCQVGLACRDPDLIRLSCEDIARLDTRLAMHEDLRDNLSCKSRLQPWLKDWTIRSGFREKATILKPRIFCQASGDGFQFELFQLSVDTLPRSCMVNGSLLSHYSMPVNSGPVATGLG